MFSATVMKICIALQKAKSKIATETEVRWVGVILQSSHALFSSISRPNFIKTRSKKVIPSPEMFV